MLEEEYIKRSNSTDVTHAVNRSSAEHQSTAFLEASDHKLYRRFGGPSSAQSPKPDGGDHTTEGKVDGG